MATSESNQGHWTDLFESPIDPSLEYFPPTRTESSIQVMPPAVVIDEGVEQWKNALVA